MATATGSQPAKKSFFSMYKREIGAVLGVLVAAIVLLSPIEGLSPEGRKCLAISLFGVVWWAMGVLQPGYTSFLMLVAWVLFDTAPAEVVFQMWTSPLVYLVIGGYLIAAAVNESGLGRRISYAFMVRFVSSYRSVIISAYVMGLLLSFLIPHPFPRSFLIMSLMVGLIKSANLPAKDAANIGLAVFAGSAPTSMWILTGDSLLNVVAGTVGGTTLSWLGWFKYMSVPGLAASALTCLTQLLVFKPTVPFKVDKEQLREEASKLGPMSAKEKRTLFWVGLAVLFWATDAFHGIHPGWIAALAAVGLALPRIGNVITPATWSSVPMGTLFFLIAAMGIGKVGEYTGMNTWVANLVLPETAPTNPFIFAALVTAVAVCIHMVLGSVLAVLSIVAPTMITFAQAAGWDPLVGSLLSYIAILGHWILPMHSMNVLVGVGESGGMYDDMDAARLGIPVTLVVFIVNILVAIPWWMLTGLI